MSGTDLSGAAIRLPNVAFDHACIKGVIEAVNNLFTGAATAECSQSSAAMITQTSCPMDAESHGSPPL